jgi:hypothetical protein
MAGETEDHEAFFVSLGRADWDRDVKGWRCDVLRLPAADLLGVFVEGEKRSDDHYRRVGDVVRWLKDDVPSAVKLRVQLHPPAAHADESDARLRELSSKNEALQRENETIKKEKQDLEVEKKYGAKHLVITGIFGLLTAGLPLTATLVAKGTAAAEAQRAPKVPSHSKELRTAIHDLESCLEQQDAGCRAPATQVRDECSKVIAEQ